MHELDIVAVPGLGGHSWASFVAPDTNTNWMKQFLPLDVPSARVILRGYNTELIGSVSTKTLEDFASSFRMSLRRLRRNGDSGGVAPIIFIAFCICGLVLKEIHLSPLP